MRLVGAGLFVYAAMLALVALLGHWGVVDRAPAWLVGIGIALFALGASVLVMWLFNSRRSRAGGGRTAAEFLAELERLGLLETATFRATRAFGVQEFEDEGLHYFLELDDGRVLFLSGQYLYDYEPITDDPGMNQPRMFPCTEFTVRRHRTERYGIDILCGGRVLEPEAVGPPFSKKAWAAKQVPEDGQILGTASYEALKRTHAVRSEP